MARHANSLKCFVATSIPLGILAACCLVVGCFGPAWAVYAKNKWIEEGIWVSRSCSEIKCDVLSRDDIVAEMVRQGLHSGLGENHWQEMKITSVIAVLCSVCVVALSCMVHFRLNRKLNSAYLAVSVVISLTSCILVLVPILKISVGNEMATVVTIKRSWSRILAGLGCVLEFITCVMLVLATSQSIMRKIRAKENNISRRNVLPESGTPESTGHSGGWMPGTISTINSGVMPSSAYTDRHLDTQRVQLPEYTEITVNNFNPPSYAELAMSSRSCCHEGSLRSHSTMRFSRL